jgi:aminoglycoside phosphotransferase
MSLPRELRALIKPTAIEEVRTGCSGDRILRVRGSDGTGTFIKSAQGESAHELERERDLLLWLGGRAGAAQVEFFRRCAGRSWLGMTEIPGQAASELARSAPLEPLLIRLSLALRALHALPLTGCPCDRRLKVTIRQARDRVRTGQVDLQDLDPVRAGRSAESLLQELEETLPASEDLVVTHGDYCLPNILMRDDDVTGLVDWGRGGIADRYQDIALLLRSFQQNAGSLPGEAFCRAYGIAALDRKKVAFYELLDEFF